MTKKLISLIIILSFIFSTSSISYSENTYSVPEIPEELLTDSENDSEKSSFDISSSDIINNVSGKENAPAEILFEDASLRDINQKHFRLNNGSNLAIIYSVPVHYKDECGEWKDINGLSGLEKTEDADGNGISQRSMVSGKLQIPNESTDNTLYCMPVFTCSDRTSKQTNIR